MPNSPNPNPPPTPVNMNVMQIGPKGAQHWQLSHNGNAGGPGHYPSAAAPANAGADFTISIVNPGNVTFSSDPIWVQTGDVKPAKSGLTDQISNVQGQGTTKLTFHDYNYGAPIHLSYQLNFNNAKSLDPIIENGGGGPPPQKNYTAYYAAGALLIALLAIVLLRNRFMRPRVMRDENGSL